MTGSVRRVLHAAVLAAVLALGGGCGPKTGASAGPGMLEPPPTSGKPLSLKLIDELLSPGMGLQETRTLLEERGIPGAAMRTSLLALMYRAEEGGAYYLIFEPVAETGDGRFQLGSVLHFPESGGSRVVLPRQLRAKAG